MTTSTARTALWAEARWAGTHGLPTDVRPEELTLAAVARQVGYSPYHFARLFRRATGESLHQRVLRARIARARQLLAETELPLAQVAAESGFAHQSHLSHVFRQELGRTPRAYRRHG